MTAIRDFVRREVGDVLASLFGSAPKKGRRGGKWRQGGPGRPPKKVAARRRKKK